MHVAAEIKVEKTKLKEVVATVVAGEEVEATKMATAHLTIHCRSPSNPRLERFLTFLLRARHLLVTLLLLLLLRSRPLLPLKPWHLQLLLTPSPWSNLVSGQRRDRTVTTSSPTRAWRAFARVTRNT